MQIVFKKIPPLAKWLYMFGFVLLLLAMLVFFQFPNAFNPVYVQQAFIIGAIIVALGSVVNLITQLKPPSKPKYKNSED